jgi:hypothetical protein
MSLQTYAVYTRCSHCGIYDRSPHWCALCGKPKDGSAAAVSNIRLAIPPEEPAAERGKRGVAGKTKTTP